MKTDSKQNEKILFESGANYGLISNQPCAMRDVNAENPYQHICRLGCPTHGTMTSSVHTYCTTARKCGTITSQANSNHHNCHYTRVHSDYNLADTPAHQQDTDVTGVPAAHAVTYVCRNKKDYDKLQQVPQQVPPPQIVQDSQLFGGGGGGSTFRNGPQLLGRVREELAGSRRSIVSSKSCENL